MGFMGTAIDRADTVSEFGGREQAIGLHDLALAMPPLGFMTPILMHLLLSNTYK